MEKAFEYNGIRFFAQWRDGTVPGTLIYCHEGEDKEELRRLYGMVCGAPEAEGTEAELESSAGAEGKALSAEADEGLEASEGPELMLVSISGVDWDKYLSPWPAGKAFKGGNDFSGLADEYIARLTGLIPGLEEELKAALKEQGPEEIPEDWPKRRGIAGYSLGGLFAVYCFYKTDMFSLLGSMSGSLWFDKFKKYMGERRLNALPEKAYFSLGDKEPQVKNQRMAAVGECTELAEKLFREKGSRTIFEWNEGGHFNDVQLRVAKGLRWLAEQ